MFDKIVPRSEDYAKWYTQVIRQAEMADYAPRARLYGGASIRVLALGKCQGAAGYPFQGDRTPKRGVPTFHPYEFH